MPCSKPRPRRSRRPFHRQHRSLRFCSLRHLLDGGLPFRRPRFHHSAVLFLLNRNRTHSKKSLGQLIAIAGTAGLLSFTAFSDTPAIDESKLPAAATNQIDFARDI